MFLQLEVLFANTSFLLLLLTMFYYWYQLSSKFTGPISGGLDPQSTPSLSFPVIQLISNRASASLRSSEAGTSQSSLDSLSLNGAEKNIQVTKFNNIKSVSTIPLVGIALSCVSLLLVLILRWKEYGHFPLSNLYESLLFLCLGCLGIHLLTQSLLCEIENQSSTLMVSFFGSITSSSALCINAFASFSLPEDMQQGSALVPALQSNWLMMHVTVMITSYAALIIGSLFSIAYLIVEQVLPNLAGVNSISSKLTSTLDNLSYRVIGLGFPLLTIGILSGAVWANEAWGSYWSWDPKETWALLTWLVFAIYLHTRITRGWAGRNSAIMASLGFITVWICFLGVNLLGEGLHSYGFLNK